MITDFSFFVVLARNLRAIANPLKLTLVSLLMQRDMTVQELATYSGHTAQQVSTALGRLRRAEIVACTKDGVYRVYALCPGIADQMDQFMGQRKEVHT